MSIKKLLIMSLSLLLSTPLVSIPNQQILRCLRQCQDDRDRCLHMGHAGDAQYRNQCMLLATGCRRSCYHPNTQHISINPYL